MKKINLHIKEKFLNWYYAQRAFFRQKDHRIGVVFPPKEYKEVFQDQFNISLQENWQIGDVHGEIQPNNFHQYYDTTGNFAYLTSNHGLALELRNIPKTYALQNIDQSQINFSDKNLSEKFVIPTGSGSIISKKTWQYGWFESWIKLPEGGPYCPRFRLFAKETAIPQIDIFQAYSENGHTYEGYWLFDKYFKRKYTKIQPTIYFKTYNKTNKKYGSYDAPVHQMTRRYVQYVCHWEPEFIKIYYDGKLVLETRDHKILQHFNTTASQMQIGFNHGLLESEHKPNESAMLVQSLTIYQKNI
jgi:hypothetical protein